MRKGLGKGMGMGYKNLVPIDSHIHSLSAKGVKSNRAGSFHFEGRYTLRGINGRWYVYDRQTGTTVEDTMQNTFTKAQKYFLSKYSNKMNAKFSVADMIYNDEGKNVWLRGKGRDVVDIATGRKGKAFNEGWSWTDVEWEDGEVERDVAKWKLNAKPSLVTPKQPKTVYHKGMYSKDADEKNMKAMKEKSTRIKKEISKLLYEVNQYKGEEAKDHEMMVITVLKDKLPHFDFLTAHTDFDATGYWKSKITDVSYDKEMNAVLQIEFLDTKNEKVGKRLVRLFEDLNDVEIGEELLYVKTQPLEETSLPLEKWR